MSLRIAIIGCGTISEIMHLPAILQLEGAELTGLFDFNEARAQLLSEKAGGVTFGKDYKAHLDSFDAAIVATPNNTHAAITQYLLKSGKHVLVEKPVAYAPEEVDEMIRAENESEGRVCVGQLKRFYPLHGLVREFIQNKTFGEVKSVELSYGVMFAYPMASDSFLKKATARGGVFFDMAVHYLDLVYWWLGKMELVHYEDDAVDGIDADAYGEYTANNGTVPIKLSLSRIRNLKNKIIVTFEHATITLGGTYETSFELVLNGKSIQSAPEGLEGRQYIMNNVDQLKNFVSAISNNTPVAVPLSEAREVLQLLDQSYKERKTISYEWERV